MVQITHIVVAAFLIIPSLAAPNPISQHQDLVSRTVDVLERGMKNDILQERSFGSFFKKIGKGIKKGFSKVAGGVQKVAGSPVGSAVLSAAVKREEGDVFEREFDEDFYIREMEDALAERELEEVYERDLMEELEEREFDELD